MDNFTAKSQFSTWSKLYRYHFFNNLLEPEPHRTGSRLSKDTFNLFLIIVSVRNDIYTLLSRYLCLCNASTQSLCIFSFGMDATDGVDTASALNTHKRHPWQYHL